MDPRRSEVPMILGLATSPSGERGGRVKVIKNIKQIHGRAKVLFVFVGIKDLKELS